MAENLIVEHPAPPESPGTLPAPRAKSTPSQRIIAAGIIVAACIWASSVLMTLIFAVLAAYFLDPLVAGLERIRVPRVLGALIALILSLSVVGALGYMAANGLDQFSDDWPRYSSAIRKITTDIDVRLERVESRVSEITPTDNQPQPKQVVAVQERQRPVRDLLVSGIGSIYSVLFLITFVPFLVFFMLAGRNAIWSATLHLFPESRRGRARKVFEDLNHVLRGYIAGNVLVAIILVLASWVFFWAIGLANPLLAGVVSGCLSMVPYLGALLSWIPPMVIGLTKWHSLGPFLAVAGTLSALHIVGNNVLIPAIVGRRAHLNVVAVTIALLFWGWVWGAIGLILAIPITATIKVICDHVDGYQTIGAWLGSS
jgi:predicted PurR-regulated permease PerM